MTVIIWILFNKYNRCIFLLAHKPFLGAYIFSFHISLVHVTLIYILSSYLIIIIKRLLSVLIKYMYCTILFYFMKHKFIFDYLI